MTDSTPERSDYTCIKCVEGELRKTGEHFWNCEACGFGYTTASLAAYYTAKPAQEKARQARQCFEESTRRKPNAPGGGDDGLSMTDDVPWHDDSIVSVATEVTEKRDRILRIPGLRAKTEEIRRALFGD